LLIALPLVLRRLAGALRHEPTNTDLISRARRWISDHWREDARGALRHRLVQSGIPPAVVNQMTAAEVGRRAPPPPEAGPVPTDPGIKAQLDAMYRRSHPLKAAAAAEVLAGPIGQERTYPVAREGAAPPAAATAKVEVQRHGEADAEPETFVVPKAAPDLEAIEKARGFTLIGGPVIDLSKLEKTRFAEIDLRDEETKRRHPLTPFQEQERAEQREAERPRREAEARQREIAEGPRIERLAAQQEREGRGRRQDEGWRSYAADYRAEIRRRGQDTGYAPLYALGGLIRRLQGGGRPDVDYPEGPILPEVSYPEVSRPERSYPEVSRAEVSYPEGPIPPAVSYPEVSYPEISRPYSLGGLIPARVSPGEYLMSGGAVARHGVGFMDRLNAGRFQAGGLTGGAALGYARDTAGYSSAGAAGPWPAASGAGLIGSGILAYARDESRAASWGAGLAVTAPHSLPTSTGYSGGAAGQHLLDLSTPGGTFSVTASSDTIEAIRVSAIGSKLTSAGTKPSWY
jgi:hypothetical protein